MWWIVGAIVFLGVLSALIAGAAVLVENHAYKKKRER